MLRALEGLGDPMERAVATTELLWEWRDLQRALRELRQRAVTSA
ncbi:hypothetical protein ABZ901_00745 [Actinacidiphila alni]